MTHSPQWDGLLETVGDDGIRVVSFDLFRTVLDRPCGLDALLRLLSEESGMDLDDFVSRRNAHGGWWSLRDMDSLILKEREMAMESRLIQLRESIVELANAAKDLGKTVIVITDNYIPSDLLTKALRTTRFPFDRIFSSADTGHTKEDGSLFDSVLGELRNTIPDLRPEQILHIGDNMVSDVVNAEMRGIRAVHYPAASELFCRDFVCKGFRPTTVGDELVVGYVAGRLFDDPYAYRTDAINAKPKMLAVLMFPVFFGCSSVLAEGDRGSLESIFDDPGAHLTQIRRICSENVPEDSIALRVLDSFPGETDVMIPVRNLCRGFLRIIGGDVKYLRFSIGMFARSLDEVAERFSDDPLLKKYIL